jgi:hypothetical protein
VRLAFKNAPLFIAEYLLAKGQPQAEQIDATNDALTRGKQGMAYIGIIENC